MLTALGWLALVILIAANALFVAAEFALTSVDRPRLNRLADRGDVRAQAVRRSVRELSFQLSGAQLGITLCSLLLGFVAEPVVASALEPLLRAVGLPHGAADVTAVVVALGLATIAQMLFGELVPQNLALARPLTVARSIVPMQRAFTRAGRPIISLFNNTANALVRGLGVEPQEELRAARTPTELTYLITSSAEGGTLAQPIATLLRRALTFGEKTAGDVMTARVQVIALRIDDTADDLLEAARTSGHSRFPVHDGDLDDVLGVVHVKHAYSVPRERRAETPLRELMVAPVRVPESVDCDTLLGVLRRSGQQLGIVVDEYGGTAGAVTLEDLVEELVGQIRDEHDTAEQPDVEQLPEGGWLVSGQLHKGEFAELFDASVPSGPFDTLGGLLLDRLGRVPDAGDQIEFDGWALQVARMDGHRVDRILIRARRTAHDEEDDK